MALLALAGLAHPANAARPTGRWLVVYEDAGAARASSAVLSRAGVRRAGRGERRLGIVPVRGSASALRALRREPAVKSVSREWARDLRRTPNDPALTARETVNGGLPGGAPVQWALARQGFPRAWDVTTGAGARVGVVDSGIDGSHPELAAKILSAESTDGSNPRADSEGHGTHVSGLACAVTGNGRGVAGAGYDCRLHVVRLGIGPDGTVSDLDVIAGIRAAADRGAHAVNMSFGGGPPTASVQEAIDYAVARGVVLVAAASNDEDFDQGAPASQLQPGNAPSIRAGKGLVVTAADFEDRRARTGYGPQISLAAYGFGSGGGTGPPGLISTFPGTATGPDGSCAVPLVSCPRRNLGGDDRYAYLQGTSMSAPQVTALAALVADLNPRLTLPEKLRLIKRTARRSGGWNADLGWGILDAGAAVAAARRVDRVAPRSKVRRRRAAPIRRGRRARVRLRWAGRDPAGGAGLLPSRVRSYDLYVKRGRGRYRRVRRGARRRTAVLRLRRGRYRFYTRARDRAGNREATPRRADLRLKVRRRQTDRR